MTLCKGGGAPSSQGGTRFRPRKNPSSSSKSGYHNYSHLGPRSVGNPMSALYLNNLGGQHSYAGGSSIGGNRKVQS
jgi:hypothetical protein